MVMIELVYLFVVPHVLKRHNYVILKFLANMLKSLKTEIVVY